MTTQTEPSVKRHPIRGALWGLLMGIGIALILFNFSIIALGQIVPWLIVIGVFIVLGILWGMFAPAKKPKGEPSAAEAPEPERPAEEAEPGAGDAPTEDEAG